MYFSKKWTIGTCSCFHGPLQEKVLQPYAFHWSGHYGWILVQFILFLNFTQNISGHIGDEFKLNAHWHKWPHVWSSIFSFFCRKRSEPAICTASSRLMWVAVLCILGGGGEADWPAAELAWSYLCTKSLSVHSLLLHPQDGYTRTHLLHVRLTHQERKNACMHERHS